MGSVYIPLQLRFIMERYGKVWLCCLERAWVVDYVGV
jgi:hypothetical protein